MYYCLSNLPKLQHFHSNRSSSYDQLLISLIDSKLPCLKTIPEPIYVKDRKMYISCAILARNSLEEVLLTDATEMFDYEVLDTITYHRLFNMLHDFKKLVKVNIEKGSKYPINELDLIIQNCGNSLREVHFNMMNVYDDDEDAREDVLLNCIPRSNIDVVSATFSYDVNCEQLLCYIPRKFPQLKTLYLSLNLSTFRRVAINMLSHLLSWIDHLTIISIFSIPNEICVTLKRFTKPNRSKLLEYIEVDYSDYILCTPKLCIVKKPKLNDSLTLSYNASYHGIGHTPLVEEFGTEIKNLDLILYSGYKKLDHTLHHLFEHCTLLMKLTLRNYRFKVDGERFGFETRKIKKLVVCECEIFQRGFECLFCKVSSIDHLELSKSDFSTIVVKSHPSFI